MSAFVARTCVFLALELAALFGSAGRLDLPFVWAVVAIHAGFMIISGLLIEPDLRQERAQPGPGAQDRWYRILAIPLIIVHWIVAGLDVGRFHWSDSVPRSLQVAGLLGFALSLSVATWAMKTNRFFSSAIRIQSDRGHSVVDSGPYAYIRHPGYLSGLSAALCGGIALGSWWGLAPLGILAVMTVRRAALEDLFLRQELPGYEEYSRRVRYRLLPGVW